MGRVFMSGHGGGGGDWRDNPKVIQPTKTGDGGTGGVLPDACNISEVTNLNSVVRAVLAGLRVAERLVVEFDPGPPQRLLAKTQTGVVVGSITSPSMLQFIHCIQAGVIYEAEILGIRGAQCQVRISPQ
jgi:hypothetical protein